MFCLNIFLDSSLAEEALLPYRLLSQHRPYDFSDIWDNYSSTSLIQVPLREIRWLLLGHALVDSSAHGATLEEPSVGRYGHNLSRPLSSTEPLKSHIMAARNFSSKRVEFHRKNHGEQSSSVPSSSSSSRAQQKTVHAFCVRNCCRRFYTAQQFAAARTGQRSAHQTVVVGEDGVGTRQQLPRLPRVSLKAFLINRLVCARDPGQSRA